MGCTVQESQSRLILAARILQSDSRCIRFCYQLEFETMCSSFELFIKLNTRSLLNGSIRDVGPIDRHGLIADLPWI